MRVIITGDRHWHSPALAEAVINRLISRYGPELTIVHGAAPGIDLSFAEGCKSLGISDEPHPADWDRMGRRAGPIRNGEMVAAGAEMCIAFHRAISSSKGTKDCARQAIAAGIPTYLVDSERAEPKRLNAGDARLR